MGANSKRLVKFHPKHQMLLDGVFNEDEVAEIEEARSGDAFEAVDEAVETQHRCPRCAYEWSGNSKPGLDGKEAGK